MTSFILFTIIIKLDEFGFYRAFISFLEVQQIERVSELLKMREKMNSVRQLCPVVGVFLYLCHISDGN